MTTNNNLALELRFDKIVNGKFPDRVVVNFRLVLNLFCL